MDTELARTFLAVIEAGSFSNAAERLHVTQSTVSARLRTLESFLGTALFVRNKSGSSLTAAGRQFQRHALLLIRTVEQARHDVGIPRGYRAGASGCGKTCSCAGSASCGEPCPTFRCVRKSASRAI